MAFKVKELVITNNAATASPIVLSNVGGALSLNSDFIVNGSFTFGDAATDVLTINGYVLAGASTADYMINLVASTPAIADIILSNSATIANGAAGQLKITETAIDLVGAIKLDGTVTFDDDGTIADATNVMTLTQDTITLAGVTKINLDGPTTISGLVVLDAANTGSSLEISGTATVAGLNISGDNTIGINIAAQTTNAIHISGAQTANAIQIGSTWGQSAGFDTAALNIGGASTIAFGSTTANLVLARYDISAQIGTAEDYFIGEYKTYATSGAGAGTVLQHGIWMGDYCGLTIAHDTTDAYATRGRTGITGTIEGNQFIGVMGQIDITGAATLEATGGTYGVYGSITSSGSGTCNRNVVAGYFTMRTNTIDLAGMQSAVVADLGGSGYADYGFLAQVGNNQVGEAAMGIRVSDSAVLPSGIKFSVDTAGSITHAFEFEAANTAATAETNSTFAGDGIKIAVDYNGTTYYLRACSAFS